MNLKVQYLDEMQLVPIPDSDPPNWETHVLTFHAINSTTKALILHDIARGEKVRVTETDEEPREDLWIEKPMKQNGVPA